MKRRIVLVCKITLIISLIVHITIKDSFYWSSLIFYAFPLPVIVLIIGFSVFVVDKRLRLYYLLLGLFLAFIWYKNSYVKNAVSNQEGFEIVFWNAFHNKGLKEAITENGNVPDVLVLVESNSLSRQYVQTYFPKYHFYRSREEIGVFSKTPLTNQDEITSEDNTTILSFETNGYNFYVVDVSASVRNNRRDALEFIEATVGKGDKTIVLGDFNTPYKSVHFKFLKDNFNHAFNEKGNGFRETWFWNIPLLSLDHIWVSKDLEVLKTKKISTWKSDHSILRTTINKD